MSFDNIILILVVATFIIVFVSIGIYNLLRFLKGKIVITLLQNSFFYGDVISGTVDIHAKSDIQANNVIVSLICEEKHRQGKNTVWEVIHKNDAILSGHTIIQKGSVRQFNFSLRSPSSENEGSDQDNPILKRIGMFSRRLGFLSPRRWLVEAVVDATGVDLSQRAYITLSVRQNNNMIIN